MEREAAQGSGDRRQWQSALMRTVRTAAVSRTVFPAEGAIGKEGMRRYCLEGDKVVCKELGILVISIVHLEHLTLKINCMFLVRYGDHLLWADLADAEMWEQLLVREARREIFILPVATTAASPSTDLLGDIIKQTLGPDLDGGESQRL